MVCCLDVSVLNTALETMRLPFFHEGSSWGRVADGVRHVLETCRTEMIYNCGVVEGAFGENREVAVVTNAFAEGE